MARYKKFKDADVRYVYDTKTEIVYEEITPGEAEYAQRPVNLQMLSKFFPEIQDDGCTDEFPGKVIDS